MKTHNLNFTDELLIKMFCWHNFNGFTAATCGSCKKTANIPQGAGWFCACEHYNVLPFSGMNIPHLRPDYGPTRERIILAVIQSSVIKAIEKGTPIFIRLKRAWSVIDFSEHGKQLDISAGRYEVERIQNPRYPEVHCLVLKGTTIGGSEKFWYQWTNGLPTDNPDHPNYGKPIDFGEYEVKIEFGQEVSPKRDEAEPVIA